MSEIFTLINAIETLRKRLSHQLPSQHISILLLVATRPGITQAELGKALGMPQGTVSRNIKILSRYYERGSVGGRTKGYGLIKTVPLDAAAYPLGVYLTSEGEDLILDLVEGMRSKSSNYAVAC